MSVLDYVRRRELPVAIAGILLFIISFGSYFTYQPLIQAQAQAKVWSTIITAWTIGLGLVRLVQFEFKDFMSNRSTKPYQSFISFWTIFITFFVAAVAWIPPVLNNPMYNLFLLDVVGFGDGTLWGIAFLSVIGASLRAFQVKNLETGVFMAVLLMWLFYSVPFLSNNTFLYNLGQWELNQIGIPGNRAFYIIETMAGLAVCVRVMIGRERGFFR